MPDEKDNFELEPTVELPLRPVPPTAVERFGRNLAAARTFRKLAQKDVGSVAGIDASYVSLIEDGRREVGIALAERLADAVGVPLGTLVMAKGPFQVEACAMCRRRP